MQLFKQELQDAISMISDRHMARSIVRAVQTDGQILKQSISEGRTAVRDRELARRANNGSKPSDSEFPEVKMEESLDDSSLDKFWVLNGMEIQRSRQLLSDYSLNDGIGHREPFGTAPTHSARAHS